MQMTRASSSLLGRTQESDVDVEPRTRVCHPAAERKNMNMNMSCPPNASKRHIMFKGTLSMSLLSWSPPFINPGSRKGGQKRMVS